MGRLGDYMEFIWDYIFVNFKLWKVYGKKILCYLLYGRVMGIECLQKFYIIDIFVCFMFYMGLIWDIYIFKFYMLFILVDSNFFSCIEFLYDQLYGIFMG